MGSVTKNSILDIMKVLHICLVNESMGAKDMVIQT